MTDLNKTEKMACSLRLIQDAAWGRKSVGHLHHYLCNSLLLSTVKAHWDSLLSLGGDETKDRCYKEKTANPTTENTYLL